MKIQRSTGDNGMMSIIKGGNAVHGPLVKQDLWAAFFDAYEVRKEEKNGK